MIDKTKKSYKATFSYERPWNEIKEKINKKISKGIEIMHLATKATSCGLISMKQDIIQGVKVRYYPLGEMRIGIRDYNEAILLFRNTNNKSDSMGLKSTNKEFIKSQLCYFNTLWNKAMKINHSTTLNQMINFPI